MKKILALVLAITMILALFTACGTKTGTDDNDNTPGVSSGLPSDSGGDEEPEELIELNYWGVMWNDFDPSDGTPASRVQDAINAITEEKLNIHINFNWLTFADYATQFTLAMANKETIDLAHYYFLNNMPNVYSSKAALDITDLLNEHASEIMDEMDWLIKMTTFDGRIYGIPTYRQVNSNVYAIFREDNLRDAGLYDKATAISTWSDFEEVLTELSSALGTFGIGNAGGWNAAIWTPTNLKIGDNISDTIIREYLGDSHYLVTVDDSGNVSSAYDDERAVDGMKMVTDWANKDLVWPDAPFSTENNKVHLTTNTYACLMTGSEYGVEANYKNSVGYDCLAVKLWSPVTSGSGAAALGAFVPVTSSNPEAAVKLLNLIWTDAELCNLFAWGIEGETYIVEDGVAKYPEGMDTVSSGFHQADYLFGNQFLCLPWEGTPANFRELALEDMNSSPISQYAGFTVDLTSINSTLAALSAVNAEYYRVLNSGMYTDELYAEFLEKLDTAGIDEYIQVFQTQLDDFRS